MNIDHPELARAIRGARKLKDPDVDARLEHSSKSLILAVYSQRFPMEDPLIITLVTMLAQSQVALSLALEEIDELKAICNRDLI